MIYVGKLKAWPKTEPGPARTRKKGYLTTREDEFFTLLIFVHLVYTHWVLLPAPFDLICRVWDLERDYVHSVRLSFIFTRITSLEYRYIAENYCSTSGASLSKGTQPSHLSFLFGIFVPNISPFISKGLYRKATHALTASFTWSTSLSGTSSPRSSRPDVWSRTLFLWMALSNFTCRLGKETRYSQDSQEGVLLGKSFDCKTKWNVWKVWF